MRTPSRRRLKKWRTRVERLATHSFKRGPRHFFHEMFRCQPLIETAKRAGVDLLDRLPKNDQIDPAIMQRLLYRFFLGRDPDESWPTPESLK